MPTKSSKPIRPLAIALPLCNADLLSAALMVEINFRADITKYRNGKNPFVVFSYEEWSDKTGLSSNQLRKAFSRLVDFGLITTYVKPHPHKSLLKVLHVEVPWEVQNIFGCLRKGAYEYLGDALKLEEFDMAFQFPSQGCSKVSEPMPTIVKPRGCTPDVYPGAHQLCALILSPVDGIEDIHENTTDISTENEHYKKKFKKDYKKKEEYEIPEPLASGFEEVFFLKKKQKKKVIKIDEVTAVFLNIPDDLRTAVYLPDLLIALRIAHGNNTAKENTKWHHEPYFTRHNAAELWRASFHSKYGTFPPLNDNERGLLGTLLYNYGATMTQTIIKNAISRWEDVLAAVKVSKTKGLHYPDVVFTYCYTKRIISALALQKLNGDQP